MHIRTLLTVVLLLLAVVARGVSSRTAVLVLGGIHLRAADGPPQPAPRQEELNFAATQAESTPAPQSSLGRSMIASAEIVESASAARANEAEAASKAPRSAALKLPAQRATQAARELAEAIDRQAADVRGKDVSRGAEMDGPDHDDGPEM